jgi:hypothetical protein
MHRSFQSRSLSAPAVLKLVSGVSLAATSEGEFLMSRDPYASKGWRATLGDKGLALLAQSGRKRRSQRFLPVRMIKLTETRENHALRVRAPVLTPASLALSNPHFSNLLQQLFLKESVTWRQVL